MRLFQIDQVIFDLSKITQSHYCTDTQKLTLHFADGQPLIFQGEIAETLWIMLGSLSCDLSFRVNTAPPELYETELGRAF